MLQPFVNGVLRKAARHSRSKPFAMRNAAPLVSFTFDDAPDTAYTNGAAILEQHGLRGTFYIATGILGDADRHWRVIDRTQVRALYDQGHEIGCHTFSHVGVDRLDSRELDEECRRNGDALRELCASVGGRAAAGGSGNGADRSRLRGGLLRPPPRQLQPLGPGGSRGAGLQSGRSVQCGAAAFLLVRRRADGHGPFVDGAGAGLGAGRRAAGTGTFALAELAFLAGCCLAGCRGGSSQSGSRPRSRSCWIKSAPGPSACSGLWGDSCGD